MATKKNALSSLIHVLDPGLFTGFHFLLTYADGIEIVQRKNAGGVLLPIYKDDDHLLERQPEQLEEGYCFTKLKPAASKKACRTFGEGSRRYNWKNIITVPVTDDNNIDIGWVTKLVLHRDKKPTEWHIIEYKDSNASDAGRWVLCQIYKRKKNNDSASPSFFDPCIDNTTVPLVASDVEAGQFFSSWPSGAGEDINQEAQYLTGPWSDTPPDWFPATNPVLIGGHMNQDQIDGVNPSLYAPQDGKFYSTQQFRSSPISIEEFPVDDESINRDWRAYESGSNPWFPATNPDLTGGHMNQDQMHGVNQSFYTPQDGKVYSTQQFRSSPNSIEEFPVG